MRCRSISSAQLSRAPLLPGGVVVTKSRRRTACSGYVTMSRRPEPRRACNSDPGRRLKSDPGPPAAPRGRLSRPDRRPLLDLLLLAQKIVDFGLQGLNPFLFPRRCRLSVFHKAVDHQVLQFRDPGALLWG